MFSARTNSLESSFLSIICTRNKVAPSLGWSEVPGPAWLLTLHAASEGTTEVNFYLYLHSAGRESIANPPSPTQLCFFFLS